MNKYRIWTIILVLLMAFFVYFAGASTFAQNHIFGSKQFKFGLDLVGGTELIYHADISKIENQDINDSMDTLRDVIERRVNVFGVSEPIIQVEEAGLITGNPDYRLIVELPGVEKTEEAIALIGQTPLLQFMLEKPGAQNILNSDSTTAINPEDVFADTGLTGALLKRSQLQFDQTTGDPVVGLEFNGEGKDLFADITGNNRGKILAIFLDGQLLSAPVINDEIRNGQAIITGGFTAEEAKELVRNLNYGALPVPIELIGNQTVGATLGDRALSAGVTAGTWGFILIAVFLIVWYRLPGFIATIALVMYIALSLSVFKLIPVTLTAAGIAGFILSIGMAVDANILIFERMKEELRRGRDLSDSIREGFRRAWLSIRDSNISSIITSIVLFWLGTSAVKGFALTLGIGVAVSMFTAITFSRTLLFALNKEGGNVWSRFLFGTGFSRTKKENN